MCHCPNTSRPNCIKTNALKLWYVVYFWDYWAKNNHNNLGEFCDSSTIEVLLKCSTGLTYFLAIHVSFQREDVTVGCQVNVDVHARPC